MNPRIPLALTGAALVVLGASGCSTTYDSTIANSTTTVAVTTTLPTGTLQEILPRMLDDLFPRREAARKAGDDIASNAIKILMNSFYGVLGTPACRFYNPALANSITGTGTLTLAPSLAATTIGVGSAEATFRVTQADLDRIDGFDLQIGQFFGAGGGRATVDGPIAFDRSLSVNAGGPVFVAPGAAVTLGTDAIFSLFSSETTTLAAGSSVRAGGLSLTGSSVSLAGSFTQDATTTSAVGFCSLTRLWQCSRNDRKREPT